MSEQNALHKEDIQVIDELMRRCLASLPEKFKLKSITVLARLKLNSMPSGIVNWYKHWKTISSIY